MLGRGYFRKCRTELKKIRGTSAHTEVPRIGEKFYVPLYSGELGKGGLQGCENPVVHVAAHTEECNAQGADG